MQKIKDFLCRFKIVNSFRFHRFKKRYLKNNKHNYTFPINIFKLYKVSVGNYSYGPINAIDFGNENEKLSIGSFCSIADNVTFILSGEHNYKKISTYPFKNKLFNEISDTYCKGPIIIEDDVWIGYGCTILSGVTIGKGAVIGAGTVVAENIPPYAIYVNGRIVKYRFDKDIIDTLLKIDFNKFDDKFIKDNIDLLYQDVSSSLINELIERGKNDER